MAASRGVLVPVTALSAVVAYPEDVYPRYVLGIGQTPTEPMIAGDLEHRARKLLVEKLWQVYMAARDPSDLREAYSRHLPVIHEAEEQCRDRYSVLFEVAPIMTAGLLNRLRIEEDARVVAAENLLAEGVTGVDLIRRVLPLKVEQPLQSHALGLEGRIDALGEINGRPFPMEYKTGLEPDPVHSRAHEIQVAAYCMLVEEELDTSCNYGEIYYTRYLRRKPVLVSRATRKAVVDLRDRFLNLCSKAPEAIAGGLEVSNV
jgi:CRISPR/Cas system-associated exonuclease Cas4 (RecB family)